jgi:hypothetical protein
MFADSRETSATVVVGFPAGIGDALAHALKTTIPGVTAPLQALDRHAREVLVRAGSDPDGPFDVTPGWHADPGLDSLRAAIERELDGAAGDGGWLLSDERIGPATPFWRPLLEARRQRVRWILCLRPPLACSKALLARDGNQQSPWTWGATWLDWTARALAGTRGAERLLLFENDVRADPAGSLERAQAFCGAPAHPVGAPVASASLGGLGAVEPEDDPADAWRLPVEARAAYALLRHADRAARDGAGPAVPATAAVLAQELAHAQRVDAALHAAFERSHPLEPALASAWEEISGARQLLEQMTEAMETAAFERDELLAELAEAKGQLERARG